jgi:hypothetical protein
VELQLICWWLPLAVGFLDQNHQQQTTYRDHILLGRYHIISNQQDKVSFSNISVDPTMSSDWRPFAPVGIPIPSPRKDLSHLHKKRLGDKQSNELKQDSKATNTLLTF